jgi:hypothetical protein
VGHENLRGQDIAAIEPSEFSLRGLAIGTNPVHSDVVGLKSGRSMDRSERIVEVPSGDLDDRATSCTHGVMMRVACQPVRRCLFGVSGRVNDPQVEQFCDRAIHRRKVCLDSCVEEAFVDLRRGQVAPFGPVKHVKDRDTLCGSAKPVLMEHVADISVR